MTPLLPEPRSSRGSHRVPCRGQNAHAARQPVPLRFRSTLFRLSQARSAGLLAPPPHRVAPGRRSPSPAGRPARAVAGRIRASIGMADACRSRISWPRRHRRIRLDGLSHDPLLVRSPEIPPPVRHGNRRGNIARRRGAGFPVSHMARAAFAAIRQPADRCRSFVSELRPPVAEPLQRQAMRLPIFPLIQVACGPALQMRTPECLQLRTLRLLHSRHDRPSCSTDFAVKDKIATARPKTTVQSTDA